ncbi:MAG: transcriptional regulator [Pirellulales bacterium]|nr:transcriptional regulator [Pirellulales bacterium]
MSEPARTINTEEIPREVLDLAEAANTLPEEYRRTIEPLLGRVIDSNRRRRRILSLVQDALSQLRLDMKYLAFDLEATRRERDDFRRKLEETA